MEVKSLRQVGLKVTLPRMKVLEILEGAGNRHLSADDIYRHLLNSHADIGLATVYRVLAQLESAGLVARHHFEGSQAMFELKEAAHHDHIVCVDCGRIDEFVDAGIEARQAEAATRLGYQLSDHALILYGRCPKCRTARGE